MFNLPQITQLGCGRAEFNDSGLASEVTTLTTTRYPLHWKAHSAVLDLLSKRLANTLQRISLIYFMEEKKHLWSVGHLRGTGVQGRAQGELDPGPLSKSSSPIAATPSEHALVSQVWCNRSPGSWQPKTTWMYSSTVLGMRSTKSKETRRADFFQGLWGRIGGASSPASSMILD